MHAHLSRWQRVQVAAMGPALWASLIAALVFTGYFAGLASSTHRRSH